MRLLTAQSELIADLELMLEHALRWKDDIIDHDDAAIGSERNERRRERDRLGSERPGSFTRA
jgi:hypothetical protein